MWQVEPAQLLTHFSCQDVVDHIRHDDRASFEGVQHFVLLGFDNLQKTRNGYLATPA